MRCTSHTRNTAQRALHQRIITQKKYYSDLAKKDVRHIKRGDISLIQAYISGEVGGYYPLPEEDSSLSSGLRGVLKLMSIFWRWAAIERRSVAELRNGQFGSNPETCLHPSSAPGWAGRIHRVFLALAEQYVSNKCFFQLKEGHTRSGSHLASPCWI